MADEKERALDIAESKVIEPIDRMLDRLGVSAVFGEAIKEGDSTVIPVASLTVGFGFGYGEGPAGQHEKPAEGDGPEEFGDFMAGGGGAGGGGSAKPNGYLRITPDSVTYEPIVDQSRIAIAGILMSAWSVFWIARTIRAFTK